jgi:hypothetical protein
MTKRKRKVIESMSNPISASAEVQGAWLMGYVMALQDLTDDIDVCGPVEWALPARTLVTQAQIVVAKELAAFLKKLE